METSTENFEKTVQVFINSLEHYFLHLTNLPVKTDAPYVKPEEELTLKECTGVIGVSGIKKGYIYISSSLDLFEDLIKRYVGLKSPSESDKLDMAGELANVVAGNVKETYGEDFMISVPMVFKGKPGSLRFPKEVPIYVIPVKWNEHEAYMVIALK